jgi:protein required for attachment to host cells
MNKKSDVTWYVVADGGKARILTRDGNSMTTLSSFDSAGHGDTAEDDIAAISQIKAPKIDPHEQVKVMFARQVAHHLNEAANANEVDHIILAAPGHILHDIKEALNKPATHALGPTLSKDLTHVAEDELAGHFS